MDNEKLHRILCVDDEPNILSSLKRQMRNKYNIVTATSPHEGLEILKNDGPFNVVISDFRMPEMNGDEFLKKTIEIDPNVTRILLTGQASMEGMQAVVNEGQVYKILLKPYSTEELHEAIYGAVQAHMDKKASHEQIGELLKSLVP